MFLLYHSDGCNTSETVFHWCYINDLHTTHAVVCWVSARGWGRYPFSKKKAKIRHDSNGMRYAGNKLDGQEHMKNLSKAGFPSLHNVAGAQMLKKLTHEHRFQINLLWHQAHSGGHRLT
jgi:hypothetical protein